MKRLLLKIAAKIKLLASAHKRSAFYYHDEEANYALEIENNKVRYLISLDKAA